MNEQVTDSPVVQNKVYSTTDYEKFKFLDGNRHVELNIGHVNELKRRIEDRGNLTQWFPITVNERFEVIDGQHRLAALKELKLPVYYEVKEGLHINDVITLNTSHKNWSWKDFMVSYAERGNHNYQNFRKLADEFKNVGFTTLISFARGERTGGRVVDFNDGNLQFSDDHYGETRIKVQDYVDLTEASGIAGHEFAMACMEIFKKPKYEQSVMEEKLKKHYRLLAGVYYAQDFYYRLEEIYYRP